MRNLRNLTEDHEGREGEKIVTEREEGKPQETLIYKEQTESGWGHWGEGKMGDGH